MRTVYLGTSEFAAAILDRLASSTHRPVLVLSRPDRPRGRGRQLGAPPVAERARSLGLALEQPDNANDASTLASIAAVAPDVIVVCAFGALIKEPLLSSYELLNVHPSLLPRWRGAAPIERTIMAGDADAGVSIMRLTAGLDSGPVCLAGAEAICSEDTYGSLAARLRELGAGLLLEALDRKAQGRPLAFVEQDDTLATYAEKISSGDRLLDPSRPAEELERVVRALHPHIGARAQLDDGSFLGVRAAALVADPEPVIDVAKSGLGVSEQSGRLLLVCSTGALELRSVQPPGGRPMDAGAYLRGHGLPGGR